MNRQSRCADHTRRGGPDLASSILRCGPFLKISSADDMERQLFLFPCVLENREIVVGFSSRLTALSPSKPPDQSGPQAAYCSIDNSGSSPSSKGTVTSSWPPPPSGAVPPLLLMFSWRTKDHHTFFFNLPSFHFPQLFFLSLPLCRRHLLSFRFHDSPSPLSSYRSLVSFLFFASPTLSRQFPVPSLPLPSIFLSAISS